MKKVALVGVASVALLGLALLWSARLVEDVAPPPAPEHAPTAMLPPDDAPRARLAPEPAPALIPVPGAAPGATPLPPAGPGTGAPAIPPPPAPLPQAERNGDASPPAWEADEPFGEDSHELEYAFRLAEREESSPEQVRNAAEVFERCLKARPDDERCYRGLVTAQTRLNPPDLPSAPRHKGDAFVPRPGFEGKGRMKPSPIGR